MQTKRALSLILLALLCRADSYAQETAIPADAFARLDSFVDPQLSPDGRRLAFMQPGSGRWGIHVHTFETGATFRIPPSEGSDYNWVRWGNDDILVFSMTLPTTRQFAEKQEARLMAFDVRTDEMIKLIKPAPMRGNKDRRIKRTTLQPTNVRADANTRIAKRMLPPPRFQDRVIDWLPADPLHILVALDEDHDGLDEVRKIDLSNGDYEIVRNSSPGIRRWLTSHGGTVVLGYGHRDAEGILRVRSENGDWRNVSGTTWLEAGWIPQALTPDGNHVYATGYGEHGTREVRLVELANGEFAQTLHSDPKFDAAQLVAHPTHGRAAGLHYITDKAEFRYFDDDIGRIQRTVDKMFPDASNRIASMTDDGESLVFVSSAATNPGTVYVWDLAAKSMEALGQVNPQLDAARLRPTRAVQFTAQDGTLIPGYLTLPAGSETELPTVVLPHGGPAARADQSYSYLTQFLASRGYAVLRPNYRGSTGYGEAFANAGRGEWGGLIADDIAAGAQWMIDQGIADASRICVVGWSFGGYAATMSLAETPGLYQCAASVAGVYDLPRFIVDNEDYEGGSLWLSHLKLGATAAADVSPMQQAKRITAPLLIVHAADDAQVDIEQANNMVRRLQRNGSPVTFVELEAGGHDLKHERARTVALESIDDFLRAHLN